jgi:hypothetical protein
MTTFSNPRTVAEFDDWPSGHARVKCVFKVHHDKRGYRVERSTQNKHGEWCKPKFTTYSGQAAIVDGSDGKTYILQVAALYGFITVMTSDFTDAPASLFGRQLGQGSSVHESNAPELHKQLLQIILAGGALQMAAMAK